MPASTQRTATPPALAAWDLHPASTPRQLYHNLAEEALIQAHALPPDDEHYLHTLDAAHLAVETVLALLGVPDSWQPVLNRALSNTNRSNTP